MPETTVQKMIGAITILISLMKPSPSALIQSLVAQTGSSQPNSAPSTIAISTWTYNTLYQGFAARRDAGVAVTAVMTFPPYNYPGMSVVRRRQPRHVLLQPNQSALPSQWRSRLFSAQALLGRPCVSHPA